MALKHLLIMRHAESEDGPPMDPTRTLTETGRTVQVPAIAEFLVRQVGFIPSVISSNMARARDTAKPIAEAVGATEYEEIWQLDPEVKPEIAWKRIKQLASTSEDVLVVTHHPLCSDLLEYLCGTKTGENSYPHAAVACVQVQHGHLKWFVNPKLVERDELPAVQEAMRAVEELMESG